MRNGVGIDYDFKTPEDMARYTFFQEFLRPYGLRWFAGVRIGDGEHVWALFCIA